MNFKDQKEQLLYEEREKYKKRLSEDMDSRNYHLLYSRDFTLGIGKYTVKQAQEILEEAFDKEDKKDSFIKEIWLSVEFHDSLKRKINDNSMFFFGIPCFPKFNQKEDIIFKY